MLDILQAPSHVAAFRLSKLVSGLDYDRMTAELEARLSRNPRITVYADLGDLERLRSDALARDLRYLWAKRKELDRFARTALVTDASWLRALSVAAEVFLPEEALRTFATSERDAALRWAAEPPARTRGPALRVLKTTRPDTIAFAWNGRLRAADLERAWAEVEAALRGHAGFRVLLRVERAGGVELPALFKSELVRVKLATWRRVERYAVVGGPRWLVRFLNWAQQLSGIDLRHFAEAQEPDAWLWLEAEPVQEAGPTPANAKPVSPSS